MRDALVLIAPDTPASGWPAAIRRIRERIDQGETLSAALSELPDPFPRDLDPFVEELESGGLPPEDLEALSAWPDAGTVGLSGSLARTFAHASILIRQGKPAPEALGLASRPGDPEPLRDAMRGGVDFRRPPPIPFQSDEPVSGRLQPGRPADRAADGIERLGGSGVP